MDKMSLKVIIKHLPGKHSQASHGKKGGGSQSTALQTHAAAGADFVAKLGGKVTPAGVPSRMEVGPDGKKHKVVRQTSYFSDSNISAIRTKLEAEGYTKQNVYQPPSEAWYQKGNIKAHAFTMSSDDSPDSRKTKIHFTEAK